jgi:hypothetical protein
MRNAAGNGIVECWNIGTLKKPPSVRMLTVFRFPPDREEKVSVFRFQGGSQDKVLLLG